MPCRGDLTNVSTAFDSATPLDLTPDGYPRSLPDGVIAHKLVLRNVQLHAMAGRYVALWDGDGVVDVLFDAKVASVGKRRLEFDFNPTANPDCWARGEAYCGDNVSALLCVWLCSHLWPCVTRVTGGYAC